MAIPYTCPHCGLHTDVDNQYAGQTGPCVGCNNPVTIPTLSPEQELNQQQARSSQPQAWLIRLGMFGAAAISLCVLMLVVWNLMRPALRAAHQASLVSQCVQNLEVIGGAIEAYRQDHGTFPPAVVRDSSGRAMHSWRVLILPYMGGEASDVYAQYDMSQPWNSPSNSLLIDRMPQEYACPAEQAIPGETSYLAIVGPNTIISNTGRTRPRDVTDRFDETLVVLESPNAAVNWLEPDKDIPLSSLRSRSSRSQANAPTIHAGGVQGLLADGSVIQIDETVTTGTLRAMGTINGGEYIDVLAE